MKAEEEGLPCLRDFFLRLLVLLKARSQMRTPRVVVRMNKLTAISMIMYSLCWDLPGQPIPAIRDNRWLIMWGSTPSLLTNRPKSNPAEEQRLQLHTFTEGAYKTVFRATILLHQGQHSLLCEGASSSTYVRRVGGSSRGPQGPGSVPCHSAVAPRPLP